MLDQELKLDDFPYSKPGYGRKIAIVGVGSAGCRIANQLSSESRLLEHFVYVSCDDHDLAPITKGDRILVDATQGGKTSPYAVRGLARSRLAEIRKSLIDSKIVFIIAGLGGTVGSGLAPLLAKEASEMGAVTVAVLVMPFNFEKTKHFFAGSALKQVRNHASGVIVIDSDELLQIKLPVIDMFAEVNQKIAIALSKLLGTVEPHEFNIGLNSVVNFVKTKSYSVLCIAQCTDRSNEYREAVIIAASHFNETVDKTQASKSIVHLCADSSITMNELVTSIGGLSGMLGNGTMQIEYGLSANSTSTTCTAIIMATGFPSTRFNHYDPIDQALGAHAGNIDREMDSSLVLESLVGDIERD